MFKYRFYVPSHRRKPAVYSEDYPYWESRFVVEDDPELAIILAYAEDIEHLLIMWPEAQQVICLHSVKKNKFEPVETMANMQWRIVENTYTESLVLPSCEVYVSADTNTLERYGYVTILNDKTYSVGSGYATREAAKSAALDTIKEFATALLWRIENNEQ